MLFHLTIVVISYIRLNEKKKKKKKYKRCFYQNLLKVRYYIYQIYCTIYHIK